MSPETQASLSYAVRQASETPLLNDGEAEFADLAKEVICVFLESLEDGVVLDVIKHHKGPNDSWRQALADCIRQLP